MYRWVTGSTRASLNYLGWTMCIPMLVIALGQLYVAVVPQDEGELLTYPWLIAHGGMPYRDIWMMYPPTTFLAIAGFVKLGLPALAVERALGLVCRLAFILLVNRALTRSWTRFSWVGLPVTYCMLFSLANPDDIRAYPWVVGLPLFWLALLTVRRRPYVAAALLFAAATIRFELGAAGLVLLGAAGIFPSDRPEGRRQAVFATAALAGALLAFFGLLSLVSGGAAFTQIFYEPMQQIGPARRLPLLPPQYGLAGAPLAVLVLACPPVLTLVGIFQRRPQLAASNLAITALLAHFLQRADFQYLLWVGALVVPWALLSLVELLRMDGALGASPASAGVNGAGTVTKIGASLTIGWTGTVVLGLYALATLIYGAFASPASPASDQFFLRAPQREVGVANRTIIATSTGSARDTRAVVAYIETHGTRRDSVFVAPTDLRRLMYNMTGLYYVLGLRPASRYMEMNPGVVTRPDVQRSIISDLHGCRWIILWNHGYWFEESRTRDLGSPLLRDFIWQRYRPVLQNADYILMERITAGNV